MTRRSLCVAVIGAGLGGLSAAAYLAHAGHRVVVFEAGSAVGGKAGRVARDGFHFDTGPTLLTLPDVVRDVFRVAGGDLDRDVGIEPIDPVCRYFFADDSQLDVTGDVTRTAAAIERRFPGEGRAFEAFMARAETAWRLAGEPYMEAPFRGYADFTARVLRRGLGAVRLGLSLGTLGGLAHNVFRTDAMRAFVGRFATYAGGDPARTSAAFAMIPHLELRVGAFHPRGGMAAIARALAARLEAGGVEIRLDTPIQRIVTERGRVTGVALEGGLHSADVVVANVDPEIVLQRLVPSDLAARAGVGDLERRERSLSGFAMWLAVRGDIAPLAHHSVLFPTTYADEFRDVFERRVLPEAPTVYVCAPSVTEPATAPPGHHALFVLVNAPASAESADWGDPSRFDARLLARIERVVPGLTARATVMGHVTPREIAALGSPDGAIYGEAPHGANAPFRRPRQKCDAIPGLYFVGGSVHPGGGAPMVVLGGRHVAAWVERDAPTAEAVWTAS